MSGQYIDAYHGAWMLVGLKSWNSVIVITVKGKNLLERL